MFRLWVKSWPRSIISIIFFASCDFSNSVWASVLISTASFHTCLALLDFWTMTACLSFTWASLHLSPQSNVFWQILCTIMPCLHMRLFFKTAAVFISISALNPRSQIFPLSSLLPAFWPCTALLWCKEILAISTIFCQHSVKLSSLTTGSRAASG